MSVFIVKYGISSTFERMANTQIKENWVNIYIKYLLPLNVISEGHLTRTTLYKHPFKNNFQTFNFEEFHVSIVEAGGKHALLLLFKQSIKGT